MRRLLAHSLALLLVLPLAGAVTVLSPAAAGAATTSRSDPRDTQGDLDLRRVRLKTKGSSIVARLMTYGAVSRNDLDNANSLDLDFKVGQDRVRNVTIKYINGKLTASICTAGIPRRDCSQLRASRTSPKSFRVVIPRSVVEKGATVYRWRATSTAWTRTAGCRTAPSCVDHLPGKAKYLRWRA